MTFLIIESIRTKNTHKNFSYKSFNSSKKTQVLFELHILSTTEMKRVPTDPVPNRPGLKLSHKTSQSDEEEEDDDSAASFSRAF